MYLTPTEKHWACDIEADDLLEGVTQIWCVTMLNCITKERAEFGPDDKEKFNVWQICNPDAIYVGHNFIAYDAVVLNRFWSARIPVSRIVDTFVLSQVYNPNYPRPKGLKGKKGPHSLEAWGLRLNFHKGDFDDFSAFTPEMLKYCMNDTILTAFLFRRLTERMRQVGFSEDGLSIEHLAWNIIQNKQKKNGFPFNKKAAELMLADLRKREEELKREIYKLWPPQYVVVRRFAKAYRLDGHPTADFTRHSSQYPELRLREDGGYDAYDWVSFNLGSPAQRLEKLLELGFDPVNLTKAGNPKVDEDELLAFAEICGKPEVAMLAKWIVVNSRANMLFTIKKDGNPGGWLSAYNEKTGAIHGKLFIASTLRYRHSEPNSANIPAVRLKKDDNDVEHIQYGEDGMWTYESRDLWTCGDPDEWVLVGIDGTGIQNRCLIHCLIETVGEERVAPFRDLGLSGDIHKHNIKVLGLANKAAAKKFYYTLMMGGRGKRLAADQAQFGTKMTPADGNKKREAMIATIPGFQELIEKMENELSRTGRIRLCDGTPVVVPSPHMVIPYRMQGDESRLMKRAMIYTDEEVRRKKMTDLVFKVADIHDEWQYRVKKGYEDDFIGLSLPCFPRSGESFGYRVPITGDAKVGRTWAETH